MTPHAKVYLRHFGIGEQDVVCCELCGKQGRADGSGFDLHHIHGRGKGKDNINNIMCLCRACHRKAHEKLHPDVMQAIHDRYLNGQTNY